MYQQADQTFEKITLTTSDTKDLIIAFTLVW